jgi:DNA-binding transcriptional ArsR family regulator
MMATSSQTRSLNAALHALTDPTRREILRRLARSEARVTDIAKPFRISLNSVSKHIRILERAKLVERRRVGREHILRFRPEPLDGIQNWISQQQSFWRASLGALDALLDQADTEKRQ